MVVAVDVDAAASAAAAASVAAAAAAAAAENIEHLVDILSVTTNPSFDSIVVVDVVVVVLVVRAVGGRYGVREMVARGDKIYISLTYSPRAKTLKRKFGNLPVKYMRAKIDKESEFKILESVVKRHKFNLLSEELEDMERNGIESSAAIPESSGIKRKKTIPGATTSVAAPTSDLAATSTAASAAPGGIRGGGSGEGGGQKKKRKNSQTKIIPPDPTQTPVTSDLLSSLLEVGLEILPPPPTLPAPSQSTTEQ
ncbi:unnamed protein product [Callosobruchus maculatus]|uniref:Uncharacterized protein n=1 Tax=Callosobruchus maculatus TaxID=64391 RepID=A0A653CVV0_CALMS|nr:unnamed protein product [Callosobruchus maculatus]